MLYLKVVLNGVVLKIDGCGKVVVRNVKVVLVVFDYERLER